MPRISVSVSQTGEVLSYEVSPEFTFADLKGFINAETGIPIPAQMIYVNGRALSDDAQTIQDAGIKDDDMLAVGVKQVQRQPQQRPQQSSGSSPNLSAGPQDQINAGIEQIRQRLLQDTRAREQISTQAPELANTIENPIQFREVYSAIERERQRREDARISRLNDDVNEENQAAIAEQIRQENIEKEVEQVMQNNPEFFASVTMLYVNVEVNGHPVRAFVDSGAQATIMSPSCAEECNVTRLIDTRFGGIARGVGTAKILGRVHRATVKIGDAELPCAFTVMEGKDVDMLLGLDMLKRYQATIDLYQNRLIFQGGVSVPFLGESEIPKKFEEAMDEEPTVSGPGGMAIGAQSGAVKPAGSTSMAPKLAAAGPSSSNFAGPGQAVGSSVSPVPRPSAPTPAQAAPEFPQASIDTLVRMGATRAQAVEALRACAGNVEYAAGMLYDQL